MVDPNSPMKLAEKIIYLNNNRSILSKVVLGKKGINYLNENFNKDKIFNDLNTYINDTYNSIEKIKLIKSQSQSLE